MTGDSENEIGQSGDDETPPLTGESSPEPSAEREPARPRAFRAWGAAAAREEKGPSVWSKLKQRISGAFTKKAKEITTQEEATAYTDAAAHAMDVAAEELTTSTSPISANDDAFYIPPDEPAEAPVVSAGPEPEVESPAEPEQAEAELDVATESSVLAHESTDSPVAELELPITTHESTEVSERETFASMEDALPGDELPPIDTVSAVEETQAPAAKKPGLFGRLFGRKSKAERAIEAAPVSEVTEADVANAAADALDNIAESAFPTAEVAPSVGDDPFAIEEPELTPVAEVQPAFDAQADAEPELVSQAEPEAELIAPAAESADIGASATVPMDLPDLDGSATVPMDLPDLGGSETVPIDVSSIAGSPTMPIEAVRPKRPSLIARLFGKKETAPRPSLEIEIHPDRIEAAAQAEHEVVEDESRFAPPPEPPARTLPAATVAEEFVIEHSEFEAPADARPTIETQADSRPTMEVVPDSRPTLEVQSDNRPTMEVESDSRSTMEIERDSWEAEVEAMADGHVPSSAMSLDDDKDTDEFEVVVPPVEPPATIPEPPASDLDVDTEEVAKKSIIARIFGKKQKTPAAGVGATVVEGNPNFLYSKFRAFYNEIIRFKHQKSEFSAGFSTAIVTDYTADLTPDAAAEAQSKKLAEMLELQTAEASWMGGEAAERYPDAKYAMAALADEIFTHMDWEGKDAWPRHLVEQRIYRTHAADVEVFKRMDKLLKDKPNTPVARDMARVYLLVLAAGFQGKYRPFELPRAIASYRQRLFEFIHSEDPLMLYAPERRIFPETAERTVVGHAVARFSGAQRWAAILFFLVTAYTLIAHMAWNRVSADLKDVTARIRAGSTTAGGEVR